MLKRWREFIAAAMALMALTLAGCGGGGGGSTSTTTQNSPATTNTVVNKGVIEKFGSIFVNGIEFKTAGAVVHLRDDNIDKVLTTEAEVQDFLKSDLKKGMVVTVLGLVDANGTTGIAREIEFRNTLKAKIDSVDLVHNTIKVMGQIITVDDPAKLAGLAAGDVVEISGLPDAKGQIKATHLEKKVGVVEFEAKGFVKLIAGSTTSFTLLLSPNALTGITVTPPAGAALPAAGSFIEVKTLAAAGGVVTATKLEVEYELQANSADVSIEPTSATVTANGSKTFTATVTGSGNTKVTWSVVEIGGGTITAAGVYTAPANAGTYHVKAVSAADTSKSATATVTVTGSGGNGAVSIEPTSATVTANGSKTFTATVTGSSNTKVTWSVAELNGGSITSSGVYTAPANAGTYHVKAVSAADTSKSATVAVTVTGSGGNVSGPFPIGTWVGPNGVSFTVSRLVTSGVLNQYAGSVSYSGGTIAVSGTDPVNGIFGGNGVLSFAVSKISGANATTVTFGSTSNQTTFSTQITGVLEISNFVPSPSDYLNTNAVFTKQ